MARVMAPYQFEATIVFMAVPGEEQGLLRDLLRRPGQTEERQDRRNVHQRHNRQHTGWERCA